MKQETGWRIARWGYMAVAAGYLWWNLARMTEFSWTFTIMPYLGDFGIIAAIFSLILGWEKRSPLVWTMTAGLGWMLLMSAIRGENVLAAEWQYLKEGIIAFLVLAPLPGCLTEIVSAVFEGNDSRLDDRNYLSSSHRLVGGNQRSRRFQHEGDVVHRHEPRRPPPVFERLRYDRRRKDGHDRAFDRDFVRAEPHETGENCLRDGNSGTMRRARADGLPDGVRGARRRGGLLRVDAPRSEGAYAVEIKP